MTEIKQIIDQAKAAQAAARWPEAIDLYQKALKLDPTSSENLYHLGLCYFGAGQPKRAMECCYYVLKEAPQIWQSAIVIGKAHIQLGEIEKADQAFNAVLKAIPGQPMALLGKADLALNRFGRPLEASQLVAPLLSSPQYAMDAQLTALMSRLYDRDSLDTAEILTQDIKKFAQNYLQLPGQFLTPLPRKKKLKRQRLALLSDSFCVSPVYFLTIDRWQKLVQDHDLIIFNRGHRKDWASDIFRGLASEWIDVQHRLPESLAQEIANADIDILYDLGGWMDAIALRALSLKPARKQYKWVGGQSVTTGLSCFDGWIGDEMQSPSSLQDFYTEPLMQIPEGYAQYTPPPYLPKPEKFKNQNPCIFSNPAKISNAFLQHLKTIPGKKVFIHYLFKYEKTRTRIIEALGEENLEFITPKNHEEALIALNAHERIIDTFPYSSGLTAYEAIAMGSKVEVVKVGTLFCERHTARIGILEQDNPKTENKSIQQKKSELTSKVKSKPQAKPKQPKVKKIS